MSVSGILVVVPVEKLNESARALDGLEGVDVHHTDEATGRIIVTLEARSSTAEVDGLMRIKALPHVILAEMVNHHFADRDPLEAPPGMVPPYLNE